MVFGISGLENVHGPGTNDMPMRWVLIVLGGVSALGCQPTPYQPIGSAGTGGYSHDALSDDTFLVRFIGNNQTPPDTVRSFLLRRSAELTVAHGFTHFAIIRGPKPLPIERPAAMNDLGPQYPSYSHSPFDSALPSPSRQSVTIQCYRDETLESGWPLIDARRYLKDPKHLELPSDFGR